MGSRDGIHVNKKSKSTTWYFKKMGYHVNIRVLKHEYCINEYFIGVK